LKAKNNISLKKQTINGLIWSFLDKFFTFGITFIVGIILARILNPREFGLIGMITIFITISQSLVNSGLNTALIRKKNCTQVDYSTVFFANLGVALIFYALLFISAPHISTFFNEAQLNEIIRCLGIVVLIDSVAMIQQTILSKAIDFKKQTRISVIASFISGVIAVYLAYVGYGVWSLVALRLIRQGINSSMLWYYTKWYPSFIFNKDSFHELFSFGSKILMVSLIRTIYNNMFYFIIGKFYTANQLGFFTRADQFQKLPSQNINAIVTRVSYPVLSSIQEDRPRLRANFQRLIRSTMLITLLALLGMASMAEPLVIGLIGEKWLPSVVYLQMLCIVGIFYPLQLLNFNILQVLGNANTILKIEIYMKLIAIPVIFLGIFFNIKIMILGMIIHNLIAYYFNSNISGKPINYTFKDQIKDIMPSVALASIVASILFIINMFLSYHPLIILGIQSIAGISLTYIILHLTNSQDYIFLKQIIINKLRAK
jgi:O-antigen/teichoic acid export membrane protein